MCTKYSIWKCLMQFYHKTPLLAEEQCEHQWIIRYKSGTSKPYKVCLHCHVAKMISHDDVIRHNV